MKRAALLLALFLCACPGKQKGTDSAPGGMPSAVKTYGALRWVPANVSYAFVARRSEDLSLLLRDAADSLGIAFDADSQVAGEWSRHTFGYNLFDPSSLEGIGVDLEGGAAVWGTGVSPTVAVHLSDPSKLDAFVERMRDNGVSLQSQMADGVEVFSIRMEEEINVSWAVVDGWVLSRIEILPERAPELGWLAGARGAAGALGGDPDFTAAMAVAKAHVPVIAADAPPVVAVLRPGRIADAVEALADGAEVDVHACLAPLRSVPRLLGVASSSKAGVTGALVADLGDPAPLSALMLQPPGGWTKERDGAVLQADLSIDVEAALGAMRTCFSSDEDRSTFGVKTAHVAVHGFDADGWPDQAAVYTDLSTDRFLRSYIPNNAMVRALSSSRKIGSDTVIDIEIPGWMSVTYLLSPTRAIVSRGDGHMETVLGAGDPPKDELFHLQVRPREIPDRMWMLALSQLDVARDSARDRTVERIKAWDEIVIDGKLVGAQAVMTVTAARHQ